MLIWKKVASVTVLIASAGFAVAQTTSTGSVTGPNGNSAVKKTTRQRGSVQSTVTGPNGQSATRNLQRGNGSASASVTGPKGKSVTRNRTSSH